MREAQPLFQLTNRHDAVLTTRQRRQPAVALRPMRSSFGPVLAPRSSFGPLGGPSDDRASFGGPQVDRGGWGSRSSLGAHTEVKVDRGVESPPVFVPRGAIWGRTRLRCRRGGGRGRGRHGSCRT
jgi:hypothetical protein